MLFLKLFILKITNFVAATLFWRKDPDEAEKDYLIAKLNKLQDAVQKGDIRTIKKIIDVFEQNEVHYKRLLHEIYSSGRYCVTQADLIATACRHKQATILYYLLKKTNMLDYLTDPCFSDETLNRQKTEAFKLALRADMFAMIEMLYDYWCGDLYWLGHNIDYIKNVGNLLENARSACIKNCDQQAIDFHSLITFNKFQQEIYHDLSLRKHTTDPSSKVHITEKELGAMLLSVLRIHTRYSDLDTVRIKHSDHDKELEMMADFEDKSTMYSRGLEIIRYELYYRKLDHNISLLILENLSALRKHLINRFNLSEKFFGSNGQSKKLRKQYEGAVKSYEKIECALYHFIYRVSEDWRLYLPENRLITTERHFGILEGQIINNLIVKYDEHKLFNGPVLYFERKSFVKCLKRLRKILIKHVIGRDPAPPTARAKKGEKRLLNDNYLKPMMYIRDYYSLRKIVNYIEAVEKTNVVLMIERALQVMGEMLKSTDESYHVSRSTKALLRIALSVETVNCLHNLRDEYLSHVDEGQLTFRIDSANSQSQTFNLIVKDLKAIKKIIAIVLEILKAKLDTSLLDKGLRLLNDRISALPDAATPHLDNIHKLYKIQMDDLFETNNNFVRETWFPAGLSIQLLKEVPWLLGNRDELRSKQELATSRVTNHIATLIPSYIGRIRHTLQLISKNNTILESINSQLPRRMKKISNNPNQSDLTIFEGNLKKNMTKFKFTVDLALLGEIKDFTIHWKSIKNLLSFLVSDCEIFTSVTFDFDIKDGPPDPQTIGKVLINLNEIDKLCSNHKYNKNTWFGKVIAVCSLWMSRLIHYRAKKHTCAGIEKLYNDYKNTKITDPKDRDKLLTCLIKRIEELQFLIQHTRNNTLNRLLLQYKRDRKFRITLEMLLLDIGNVLAHWKIRKMNKSTKLLRGIDLGNVLDHGNPFLEEIGDIIEPHAFAIELLTKAIKFSEECEVIKIFYDLFKCKAKYMTIKDSNRSDMDDTQEILFDQLIQYEDWESYLNIIPARY